MIEPTNNRAERRLRPTVIMRKLTLGKRSHLGASNQAAIMSTVETSALNGIELLDIFLTLSVKPLTSLVELPKVRLP
jgi:hypothetical protein